MQPITNFSSLNVDKENIMPIPQGRSASKLNELINADSKLLQSQLVEQRTQFENSLDPQILQDSDDPLDAYLQYIKWIRDNYKTGNTHESLLIQVLERTTHDFKDDDYYKNEIRYFKVWLEYITYSDHPGDVFSYLLKKKIGSDLSLFYEKYSLFFELNDQWENAEEILKLGIANQARPLTRLVKSYDEFLLRRSSKVVKERAPPRGLSNPGGTGLTSQSNSKKKESKIKIFQDNESNSGPTIFKEINNSDNDNFFAHIDTIKHCKKENLMNPTSWRGETLKNSGKTSKDVNKIEVFDEKSNQYPVTKTIKHQNGRHFETFDFNFELFMPSSGNPLNMTEVLLLFHKNKGKPLQSADGNAKRKEHLDDISYNTPRNKKSRTDQNSGSTSLDRSSGVADTPLLEYFKNSKSGLFKMEDDKEAQNQQTAGNPENKSYSSGNNVKSHKPSKKSETAEIPETEENLLDAIIGGTFSDIFTDTMTKQLYPKTPPKNDKATPGKESHRACDIVSIDDGLLSSPFVENPADQQAGSLVGESPTINPFDSFLKIDQIKHIETSFYQNNKMHNFESISINKLRDLHKMFKSNSPPLYGSKPAVIELEKDVFFSLTREVGRGGFATVYLGEQDDGELSAIKIESPSNIWEAYILSKLNEKCNDFLKLKSLYKFEDESYLILPYLQQGTILDLINNLSDYQFLTGQNLIEESLVIYFSIQLIANVLKLHSLGIVHCDIKPDNCMLNIQNSDTKLKFNDVVLIDFGRAVDLSLFPENAKFICKLEKTDNQDCPEFINRKTWVFEPDYYGIADVIHTLLFSKVIKVQSTSEGVQLLEPFKRYWQRDLWNELFCLLLNPRKFNERGDITKDLERVLGKLESWFNLTVDKRMFLEKLTQISEILNSRFKKMK